MLKGGQSAGLHFLPVPVTGGPMATSSFLVGSLRNNGRAACPMGQNGCRHGGHWGVGPRIWNRGLAAPRAAAAQARGTFSGVGRSAERPRWPRTIATRGGEADPAAEACSGSQGRLPPGPQPWRFHPGPRPRGTGRGALLLGASLPVAPRGLGRRAVCIFALQGLGRLSWSLDPG